VPVCAHLGFTPQTVNQIGGYKIQGKTEESAKQILKDAKAMSDAGASFVLLEMVPAALAKAITENIKTPTIGIGAGVDCSGQVLVLQDLLGIYTGAANPFNSSDTTFFVAGKNGAKGGNTRGTAVFGGDTVISGSAYLGTSNTDTLVVNGRLASDIIPDGNRTRNLGSDTARFANVYTGDLHLRNERGDYTLIEEEDCLTIRFNKTGKRYKFVLERAPEYDE
jgi:hypothetical protein